MSENEKFLTIHGHFYQPPRENPWIEEIEVQESAHPNHDWNEKISAQCYAPNATSRMVDYKNFIIKISNNYKYISFNFGPTLLSWMEKFDNYAYQRIIQADIESRGLYNGHGCAIAQVYNHIILPLANNNDKITQVIWGLKDFQKRFYRNAEGIWLAETAVDAQTLEILIDYGLKFTILSPYQAKCINKIGEKNWQDVSWGSIDPSQPYRYYVEGTNKEKYIDLFFYDGSISKSVAFDSLLTDGIKFCHRLNDGFSENRNRAQLVNIATDGESYGHHTKFGDMALAYVVNVGAKENGFTITNYAEFLEKNPPTYEVDIKPVSSWSCAHGVDRWQDDCGCSTGAQPHWNQKWRKPLRQALDYLRDELIKICSFEGNQLYKDFWEARNNYIDVIIDRSENSVNSFLKENCKKRLTQQNKIKAIKLMEIQRFTQLMYTSCGWFFADISGIETTQILKYAARAIELAKDFSNTKLEKQFLSILQKAKSNISEFGSGKDIYLRFVKSAAIDAKKVAAQYIIEKCLKNKINKDEEDTLYCYKIKNSSYKKYKNTTNILHIGKIETYSTITLEKEEFSYAIVQNEQYELYCHIKKYVCQEDYTLEKNEISKQFKNDANVENIKKTIVLYYDKNPYTLKDLPVSKRKKLLEALVKENLKSAAKTYDVLYKNLLNPIAYLHDLGMDIPESFRVCAKYTLLSRLDKELLSLDSVLDHNKLKKILDIKSNIQRFNIKLTSPSTCEILSDKLNSLLVKLSKETSITSTQELIAFFKLLERLEANIEIKYAQDVFYELFCENFEALVQKIAKSKIHNSRQLYLNLLTIGEKLHINVDFYKSKIDSYTGKIH